MYFHYNPQCVADKITMFSAKSGRHWHQDGAGPSGGGRRGPWASQGAVARGHDAMTPWRFWWKIWENWQFIEDLASGYLT